MGEQVHGEFKGKAFWYRQVHLLSVSHCIFGEFNRNYSLWVSLYQAVCVNWRVQIKRESLATKLPTECHHLTHSLTYDQTQQPLTHSRPAGQPDRHTIWLDELTDRLLTGWVELTCYMIHVHVPSLGTAATVPSPKTGLLI